MSRTSVVFASPRRPGVNPYGFHGETGRLSAQNRTGSAGWGMTDVMRGAPTPGTAANTPPGPTMES